ncbi:acyltransferase [Phocaeicola sp. KGMB11183]|uniref:Acyltransferase n=1 Tax=Phocaeicola acetigenes TaxID=3016083 RepID=A0ABT4PHC4_9BACT|nr:acyltransferase [Phocaeicola sp. KGMB11183]MCZ8372450.1 acyltransferase [Phocaeicola sp. KGMB11183]
MKKIIWIYKGAKISWARFYCLATTFITKLYFILNNVKFKRGLKSSGTPVIHLSINASCYIGEYLTLGNWVQNNASGIIARCKIEVRNQAILQIGNHVGITATTIICHNKIIIEDHVKIGVGTHIYDTNFHNINPKDRIYLDKLETVRNAPIYIKKNAFIGAFCIILKGVTIGENSIIAAGSVVVHNVPANEIWGGNPAQFIKKIDF